MLKQTSQNFRQFFLLEFTKELIRNTLAYKEFKIKKEVRTVVHEKPTPLIIPPKTLIKKEILRSAVKEKIKKDDEIVSYLKEEKVLPEFKKYSLKKPLSLKKPSPYRISPRIEIPMSILPETVRDIQPIIGSRIINLGKLDPLVRDPLVRVIECNGPNEKIIVMGVMGRKSTGIILTKEEIDETVKKFSDAAKIPVHEGIFRVAFGGLFFSTIVSEIIGSKFLIKKVLGNL